MFGDALDHLRQAARGQGAFELFVHWLDGRVDLIDHVEASQR